LALRYKIAWFPEPKVVVREDADNRTAGFLYLGDYPFMESARAFQRERGLGNLDEKVQRYLAQRHTGLLRNKWLTGEKAVIRQIARDFWPVHGYRGKCALWYLLSWTPHGLVLLLWKTKQRLAGRSAKLPEMRSMYRSVPPSGSPHISRGLQADELRLPRR
jgi:hypothetical protein